METTLHKQHQHPLLWFKIDLIVWKPTWSDCFAWWYCKFKIDLIVWKLGNRYTGVTWLFRV